MDELCRQAAHNNRAVEITGGLFARGLRFLQALEGPRVPVEDTFLRIIRDPRHHDLVLLSRRIVTRREFGDWDMACYNGAAMEGAIVERVAALAASAPASAQKAFADLIA